MKYLFVKTAYLKNQPNFSVKETLEGNVVVQGTSVFIVPYEDNQSPNEPALTFKGDVWIDERNQVWNEWSIEIDPWDE